jgi:hypothetical protein
MDRFLLARHAAVIDLSLTERRLEPRFAVSEPVEVGVLETDDVFSARTLDASESGLSLASPLPLQPETFVRVVLGDAVVLGEVRYCNVRLNNPLAYTLGVAIEYVFFGWKQFYNRARNAAGASAA